MAQKKEDEIMAEYLLKGGKMLERTCKQCGCPMFEYKKKTLCVVCAERGEDQKTKNKPVTDTSSPEPSGVPEAGMETESTGYQVHGDTAALASELINTVRILCARIRTETDPDRCCVLMDAVRTGIEALRQLSYK